MPSRQILARINVPLVTPRPQGRVNVCFGSIATHDPFYNTMAMYRESAHEHTPTMPAARDHRSESIALWDVATSDGVPNGVDGCPSNAVWRRRPRETWHPILHKIAEWGSGLEWTSRGRPSSHSGSWWWVVEGKMRMAVAPVKLRTKEQASDRV